MPQTCAQLGCISLREELAAARGSCHVHRIMWGLLGSLQAYEFTDTLIMVLKKNERQITFLHIYHHATTFFPCW